MPDGHTPEFQVAARLTMGGLPEELQDSSAPKDAIAALNGIIGEVMDLKRTEPADDVISKLVHAEGDLQLGDDLIKGLCINLLLAGHETTASSSCMVIGILLEDEGQRRTFIDHPDRLPESIEELIKFQSMLRDAPFGVPRSWPPRRSISMGKSFRRGIGSWPAPPLPTLTRRSARTPRARSTLSDPMPHWLTFGFGPHTCLGQHLARAEVQAMVWRLLERFLTQAGNAIQRSAVVGEGLRLQNGRAEGALLITANMNGKVA